MKHVRLFQSRVLLFLILMAAPAFSQDQIIIPDDPAAQLPVDSKITVGKFENGLTYYVRENFKPEKRAELRLVIKAGSVLEDDNQLGLAHFVEHMAFNGTRNYAKQELVDYLESIGMRFGPDLNAYTSFDETVYMLQIPTDTVKIVETAFQILEDWASGLLFEEEEVDKERGVVIEEWRLGRGAQARMRDEQFPILLKGSRYADRIPIGSKEILETFDPALLRKFYQDWYRPELMSVIAIGDFDREWILELIRNHFSDLGNPSNPRERIDFPVPDHEETRFAIASDPEATSSSLTIYYKHAVSPEGTVGDYRRQLVEILYNNMLNERFQELTREANPPFLYGYSGNGRFIGTKDAYFLGAGVKENGIEKGLETLLVEARRVEQFGFTESEVERQKKAMLRSIQMSYDERDKTNSRVYASEFIRSFLYGEPIPGIEYELALFNKYVPGIRLSEVNGLGEHWIRDSNRVIMVNTPEKEGGEEPTEAGLTSVFEEVGKTELTAYEDEFTDMPLLEEIPTGSSIVNVQKWPSIETEEWTLANGIRVVIKPTDFKNDEVQFTSYSPGGTSLTSDADIVPAATSILIIRESGFGNFNLTQLEKLLTGKVVSVSPYIGELFEGISGSASPKDLETMFQLIYLTFTQPRLDATAFESIQFRLKGFLENRDAQPETAYRDTIQVTMSQYHPRHEPWSEDRLNKMDLARSVEIYKERFADASDFVFFFVGTFDPDTLKPLVETYLGGLPALNRHEKWKDIGVRPPKGVVNKTVKRGLEDKSQVRIMFTGDFEWNRLNRYHLGSMASVLNIKLREALREDMGGTYGVGVNSSPEQYPVTAYSIAISFGCASDRVEELTAAVFSQIDSLKRFGADELTLTKVKETQRRSRETNLKQNGYWLNTLQFYHQHGVDLTEVLEFDSYVNQLKSEDIQKAAQLYFDLDNYVKVVLLPESG